VTARIAENPSLQSLTVPPPRGSDQPAADQDPQKIGLTQIQKHWREYGCITIGGMISDKLIDQYCRLWMKKSPGQYGWATPTPYMHYEPIKDLCLDYELVNVLDNILGEEVGVNLNQTGWRSTQKPWHQIGYLNPPKLGGWYLGVAVALENINPASGPLEYVPKSHHWPRLDRDRVFETLGLSRAQRLSPEWPSLTEAAISDAIGKEISLRESPVRQFLGEKGDIFIWHSGLVCRDSEPTDRDSQRKTLVSHYSALSARDDMPIRSQHKNGKWYFVHNNPLC